MEVLDLNTLSWSYGPSLPTAIQSAQIEVYKNSIWLVGGFGSSKYYK